MKAYDRNKSKKSFGYNKEVEICKFCNQQVEKLVDSHIIPKAFFIYTKNEANKLGTTSDFMLTITNSKGELPSKKNWIGWYDRNLVCKKCESMFGPYDSYAIDILLKNESKHIPIILKGQIVAWRISSYDYKKLKLFIISIMWRIGASQMPQFKKINLGINLSVAKKLLLNADAGDTDEFSFLIARFGDKAGKAFLADPHPESKNDAFGETKSFRVYLGAGYILYIKVDKGNFPIQTLPFVAKEGKPLWILRREDFVLSKDWAALRSVLNDSNKQLESLKKK